MTRPLTAREVEILQKIAEGQTNGQIAREMHVVERVVTGWVSALFTALGARSRAQAVHLAYLAGVLAAPDGACCRAAVIGWLHAEANRLAAQGSSEGNKP